jgi:hypothetical protein
MGMRLDFPQRQAIFQVLPLSSHARCLSLYSSVRCRGSLLCPETLPEALFPSISLDESSVVQNQLHYIMYENSKCEKLDRTLCCGGVSWPPEPVESVLQLLASPRQLYRDSSLIQSSASCYRENNVQHLTRCLCRQIRGSGLGGNATEYICSGTLKHVHRESATPAFDR